MQRLMAAMVLEYLGAIYLREGNMELAMRSVNEVCTDIYIYIYGNIYIYIYVRTNIWARTLSICGKATWNLRCAVSLRYVRIYICSHVCKYIYLYINTHKYMSMGAIYVRQGNMELAMRSVNEVCIYMYIDFMYVMHMYMCIYPYKYMSTGAIHLCQSNMDLRCAVSMRYVQIYMYIYVCIYTYIYIYT